MEMRVLGVAAAHQAVWYSRVVSRPHQARAQIRERARWVWVASTPRRPRIRGSIGYSIAIIAPLMSEEPRSRSRERLRLREARPWRTEASPKLRLWHKVIQPRHWALHLLGDQIRGKYDENR